MERQKLESLGVLTGGIAHDFNNLLGSILAEAELAELEASTGSSPGEQIQRIKAVAIRAAEIVRELMIYSGQDQAESRVGGSIAAGGRDAGVAQGFDLQTRGLEDRSPQGPSRRCGATPHRSGRS